MDFKSSPKSVHKREVDLNWVLKYLKDGVYPTGLNFSEKRMVRKRAERFCYLNGDLYYLGTPTDQDLGKKSRKVLLTHAERWKKVEELHIGPDGTHNGLERTADAIVSEYHWVGIYRFIKDYIRQCTTCRVKHPSMLSVKHDTSSTSDGSFLDTLEGDDSVGMTKSDTRYIGAGEGADAQAGKILFWDKVDMRLFGPYKHGATSKYVLGFVDCDTKWSEAYIIDGISPTTVGRSILHIITRYGVMTGLLMSKDDEILEDSLVRGLELLDTEANIQIPFYMEERDLSTDSLYKELEVVLEKFVKKYPNNWNENLEFCLMPFRTSRPKKTQGCSPFFLTHFREAVIPDSITNRKGSNENHLTTAEKLKSIDVLMSIHLSLTGETGKPSPGEKSGEGSCTPPQHSEKPVSDTEQSQAVHVTRSRTGNTKPKSLDEEMFEVGTGKRKSSVTTLDTPTRKRVRVETIHPKHVRVETINPTSSAGTMKDAVSDTESEDFTTETKDKKAVDLDSYYKAIEMYVQGNGYPGNSSNSFKRLIRDQAKNYSIKDGALYHEVGNKGIWKRIITPKDERVKLLTDIYRKTTSKAQMIAELEDVHWKGKLIDCEAFVLASPYLDKYEQKPYKDSSLRHLAESKRLLKYDTIEVYNEIKNCLIYEVYSNDEMAKKLDEIKRQLKFFKVENDELIYVIGNKKRKVLISGGDRQKAVQESHLKKGTHGDLNSSFNQLADAYFWFGMKLDVKIYINYCCTTTQDNKHLIDRYFIFREHHMKNYMEELEDRETDEVNNTEMATQTEDHITEGSKTNQEEKQSPSKSSGIFVSSLHSPQKDLEKAMPTLAATLAAVETSLAANTGDSVITTTSVASNTTNMIGEDTTHTTLVEDANNPEVTEETVVNEETVTTAENPSQPGTIIVKLSDDGQTVLVTKTMVDKPSDDVTAAAVKSILPHSVVGGSNGQTVDSQSVTTSDMGKPETDINTSEETKGDTGLETGQTETVIDENIDLMPLDIIEGEEAEESDEVLYDTDEDDDEDGYFEDEITSPSEGMGTGGEGSGVETPGGEKKPVTPRQHFKCSQCNKIFFGPIKFKMHMYKHTGHKPFPCNQCNKKYTNKKSLVIHQRTHSGDLPYLCTLCGKRTPSKISLKSHLKCHDGKGGGFPAKCDVCGREFTRRHLMERHKLHKHTNAPDEYKCTECNKTFGHQRSLKRHYMSAHMGVKNHTCTLCGKSFYRKEYLTGHLLQHGGAAAEGITKRQRASTFKPRPSVFAQSFEVKSEKGEENIVDSDQVQRIILHQDENGQLRVVDLETEREVKRMLDSQLNRGEVGETMVVHIEEPTSGRPQVVHVEQTEEQIVEVPIEGQGEVEYQLIQERPQEYVISGESAVPTSTTQYIYATSGGEIIQGNQDLVYGQPAVQYEVECVGDVGDEEALSAINLLAQASAQQYETVISQI